jgi:hypothetical protein
VLDEGLVPETWFAYICVVYDIKDRVTRRDLEYLFNIPRAVLSFS